MEIYLNLNINANSVIKRILKRVLPKLLEKHFIEVKYIHFDKHIAVLNIVLPALSSISNVLEIIYNQCEDYIKNNYLINDHILFEDGFSVKMVS